MPVRNLEHLLHPTSVAVIGASRNPSSIGYLVMRNLLEGGFEGPVLPVNPKYDAVAGVLAYRDVASLPVAPDMAVICTPPRTVPGIVAELGARGTHAAVVITAGLSQLTDESGRDLKQATLDAARPHGLRLLGPNCVGILVPGAHLNASFAHTAALPGSLAFVAQSGALATAVLDWARSRGIGFSHFVSVGNMADIDLGDVLDYLGSDEDTSAILLYIESVTQAREFMSAARAAARSKPVLAIKSGRNPEGARAAATHTGALAGADDVYDAALQRAGMLRVFETEELFDAAETLARVGRLRGERLAIVSNGGGPAVMAADALAAAGGRLAELADETLAKLDKVLPATWSRANPVDLIGDAPGERYAQAIQVVLADPGVDALLVLGAPAATVDAAEAAGAVIDAVRGTRKPVLTSWLGADAVEPAREAFAAAEIATYDTPEHAVRAFMHLVRFRRNQEQLTETPPAVAAEIEPDVAAARAIIEAVLADGRALLTEPEAKAVLAAYGIPVVETRIAPSAADAARLAGEIGLPVALKILSPDISHKSDVGGVALDLETAEAVTAAAEAMAARAAHMSPGARLEGFTVQAMARRPGAHELLVGATTDPVFGPVILFGQGGTAVEVVADKAVALPPLNANLARALIRRTRVHRLLAGYRDRPPADLEAVRLTLIQVAQLVMDVPEVIELDINPLFADEHGVLALDARLRVAPAETSGEERLAIRPYPSRLEETMTLRSGRQVLLRPIRPEDEPAHQAFFARLEPQDVRFRFWGLVRELPHAEMTRFTQIDYDRQMAFIATAPDEGGAPETLGVVRTVTDPDNAQAEFAIVVRSDLKGQGLGRALMEKIIRYTRDRGTGEIVGRVMIENEPMLALARRLGFSGQARSGTGGIEIRLPLNPPAA